MTMQPSARAPLGAVQSISDKVRQFTPNWFAVTMGTGLLMPSFIAIIVGGIGSLPGTLVGGLLIGVASGLTAVFLPAASEAVIYVLMAVVLLLRPRGLFGEEGMMS